MIQKVDSVNFAASIVTTINAVSVVLLFDPYGPCGSVHQQSLANLEVAYLYYRQYGMLNASFFKGDVVDRAMVEVDIKNVQCAPSFFFYVGDGAAFTEYHRHYGVMSAEQIKYFVEQKRA